MSVILMIESTILSLLRIICRRRARPETPSEQAQYGYMADMQAVFLQQNAPSGGVEENQPTMMTFSAQPSKRLTPCDAKTTLNTSTDDVDVVSRRAETSYGVSTFETPQRSKWPTSVTVARKARDEYETRVCDAAFQRN